MQAQSVLLRRPFDGGYSYAESFDGLHFVKPALGLVTNVTIWSRHAPLEGLGGSPHESNATLSCRWDNKVGLGDRIDVGQDSNLLPIGLGEGPGDTITVTASATSAGMHLTTEPQSHGNFEPSMLISSLS